jgi:hypothetical protein
MHLTKQNRTVVARIMFDSFFEQGIRRVRGGAAGPARQFILRDEEYDIHIKISGDEKCTRIRGQLLPRSGKQFAQPAQCHLLRNGARLQSTTTNETGEFHFDEIPPGDLNLQVDLPGLTIVGSLNPDAWAG